MTSRKTGVSLCNSCTVTADRVASLIRAEICQDLRFIASAASFAVELDSPPGLSSAFFNQAFGIPVQEDGSKFDLAPISLVSSSGSMDDVQHRETNPDLKPGAKAFVPTQWSLVRAAGQPTPESSEALDALCRAYWPPIFAHLRMKGHNPHEAEDLAQEFFARLLRGNAFASVSPEKGRFRTFLLAALKHFLINEWKRGITQKRGGGLPVVDLDGLDPAVRDACEPRSNENPELAFDRRWALTLLAKVRSRMRREYEAAGQTDRHDALKGYLLDGVEPASYQETAVTLGISESAVKSAVYKLRQRFGELLRAEIARTVETAEEVDDELRHLIEALRG